MRTPDDATWGLRSRHVIYKVEVDGLTLSSIYGSDWIVGIEWGTNVDQPLVTLTLSLWREQRYLSLAPLREDSLPNIDGVGGYVPAIALGGLVKLSTSESATVDAANASGSAAPFHEVFRGRIVDVDWAGNPMAIRCVDVAGDLADAFLTRERWYGRGGQHRGTLVWAPGLPVQVGERVIAATDAVIADVWECSGAGTTAATEPTWASNPMADGSAEWTHVVVGNGVWAPEGAHEVGDAIASGRYLAAAWAASTVYTPGTCVLESGGGVHRYVLTNAGDAKSGTVEPDWATDCPGVGDTSTEPPVAPYGLGCTWSRLHDDELDDPADDAADYRYLCSVAGTTMPEYTDEPQWPVTAGAAVTEGSGVRWVRLPLTSDGLVPIEAVLQGIIEDASLDNGLGTLPQLYAPVSPGYWMQPFRQQQMSALDAMRRIAGQIGWDLRLTYVPAATDDATWGRWRLWLYEPDRDSVTSQAAFNADDYLGVRRGRMNLAEIRNVIEVTYQDWTDMQPDGRNPSTKRIVREDAASIALYGRRWMGLGAGTSNEVNTLAEAQALGDAILSDLAMPNVDLEIEMPYQWWPEIGDVYAFAPDMALWSSSQQMAVVGFKHAIRQSDCRTAFQLRGKPSAGVRRWHERGVEPGKANPSVHVAPSSEVVTATATLTGVAIEAAQQFQQRKPGAGGGAESRELHVSTSNGFTPSGATLVSTSRTSRFDVAGLTPGVVHYGRIFSVDARGFKSAPSAQFTFTPSYVDETIMNPALAVGVAFSLTGAQTTEAGVDLVEYNSADIDQTSICNTTTHKVTVPSDGFYRVFAQAQFSGLATGDTAALDVFVGGTIAAAGPLYAGQDPCSACVEAWLDLNADDEITIKTNTTSACTIAAGAALYVQRLAIPR